MIDPFKGILGIYQMPFRACKSTERQALLGLYCRFGQGECYRAYTLCLDSDHGDLDLRGRTSWGNINH